MNTNTITEQTPIVGELLENNQDPMLGKEELVTDEQLIQYLDMLQQQQKATSNAIQSSRSIAKPLTISNYKRVLQKFDIRDKVIDRVTKCIVNNKGNEGDLFNRMYLNSPTHTANINMDPSESTQAHNQVIISDDISPYVLGTHDKLVIRLYRKYQIYDILIYNHTKETFSFLIFPIKGNMMELTIPVKQIVNTAIENSPTVKIGLKQIVGILIATIAKNL